MAAEEGDPETTAPLPRAAWTPSFLFCTGALMTYNEIKGDFLEGAERKPTPNVSSRAIRGPRFIVIHYTAGPSLERAVNNFLDPSYGASSHLVIGESGKIIQLASFKQITWHAGKSFWKPAKGAGRFLGLRSLNNYSLGIELVNAGPLTKAQDGKFFTWWGKEVPLADVVEVDPNAPGCFNRPYWQRFPEEQIWACQLAVQALMREYPVEEILGHSNISPGRKQDPGPAFPLQHLRAIAEGRFVC